MPSTTFTHTHTVVFHETDAAGFAHFTHYLRWMEEAEHAFLKSLDIPVFKKEGNQIHGWPRVDVHISYHKMLKLDSVVTIQLSIQELLTKGVKYSFKLLEKNQLIAEAEMTTLFAHINDEQIQIKTLEENLKGRLEIYCG